MTYEQRALDMDAEHKAVGVVIHEAIDDIVERLK
jgi:hypothetical protein